MPRSSTSIVQVRDHPHGLLPRRPYRPGFDLSILGFGGMTLVGMDQARANRTVAEAVERGINYFDVAPFYGDGEAERILGAALEPFRDKVFLACKTLQRTADGANGEMLRSLARLRTDHFDLYQHHAVSKPEEVERIFSLGGAAEAFDSARASGRVRFLGFSAHSERAALTMMDAFAFDSILFPVNFVCYSRGNFGPAVLKRVRKNGMACLALKSMALRPWHEGEERVYPNCWYRPIDQPELALEALRFSLSEEVVSAIPPGDARLFRLALDLAPRISPMSDSERKSLFHKADGLRPIMRAPSGQR